METGQNHSEPSQGFESLIDDDSLVKRARQGDMSAYGRLVGSYQDRLFNMILKMVHNRDDAMELTQESFVKALQGLKKFRQNSRFYTWLFRIGYNLTLNHCRHRGRMRWASLPDYSDMPGRQADGLSQMADPQSKSPHEQAQTSEAHERVLKAINQLEDAARAIVILRDIEHLDYAQIARIMDIPVGTVKSRLFRARLALRELLTDKDL